MATKPTIFPRWAQTAGGADASNIATPTSGESDTGYTNGQAVVSSSKTNWLFNLILKWLQYLGNGLDLQVQALVASSWFKQTSGSAQNLKAILGAPNNSMSLAFIALGESAGAPITILTSADGVTWTSRTGVGTSNTAISGAFNSAGSLAVALMNGASGQNVQTSPDGTTWTLRTSNIALGAGIGGVVHNGSLWVIVGGVGGAAAVATSTDGTTWTARTLGAATDTMVGVCWAPSLSLFIAVGFNTGTTAPEVFTSPDGITWTSRTVPTPGTSPAVSVAWSVTSGLAMFVTKNGSVWTSPDGINWTKKTSATIAGGGGLQPGANGGGPMLLHTGRQWLIVGSTGSHTVLSSSVDDGATWNGRREGAPQFNGIAQGYLGQMVIVGNVGVIWSGLTVQLG